jgi:hypothetical protein
MIDILETIWKWAQPEVLSQNYFGGAEDYHKNLSDYYRCPNRIQNQAPSEYRPGALPLEKPSQSHSNGITKYSAFNRGGNRERSVKPEQHLSRIAGVTADSGMSQQR